MKSSFLEGWITRPQGGPMIYPSTFAARWSQFPWRHHWHRSLFFRYSAYTFMLIVIPMYWKIDKFTTSKENKALWQEKRKKDHHHWQEQCEKLWEVRT